MIFIIFPFNWLNGVVELRRRFKQDPHDARNGTGGRAVSKARLMSPDAHITPTT
jgi:hypothetical protein